MILGRVSIEALVIGATLSVLTGCAGGGGGGASGGGGTALPSGGGPAVPASTSQDLLDVPTLTSLNVESPVSTRLTASGFQSFTSTPTISARTAAGDIAEIRLAIPQLGISTTFVTNDFTSAGLGSSTNMTLVYGSKAVTGGTLELAFVEPELSKLQYHTLGEWSFTNNAQTSVQGGFFSVGNATPATDIPTTGSATFIGAVRGAVATPAANIFDEVTARGTATVDFAARTMNLSTTNSLRESPNGALTVDSSLNLSGTLSYASGTNSMTGSLRTNSGLTGPSAAKFFGPAATEVGGTFELRNGPDTTRFGGGFALERN